MLKRKGVVLGFSICMAIGFAAFALAPKANADALNQKTIVTVNGPVAIPGRVLPAGTYTFQMVDPNSGEDLMRVGNQITGRTVTFLLVSPVYRQKDIGQTVVKLEEPRGNNAHPAIHEWFFSGNNVGHKFIYPNHYQGAGTGTPMLQTR